MFHTAESSGLPIPFSLYSIQLDDRVSSIGIIIIFIIIRSTNTLLSSYIREWRIFNLSLSVTLCVCLSLSLELLYK